MSRTPLINREEIKDKTVGVRVTPALYQHLVALAEEGRRSVGSLVRLLLETHPLIKPNLKRRPLR